MNAPSKLHRFLDLIAFLVARRLPVSADELLRGIPAYAERWQSDDRTAQETARRMFERDKDELRKLGIPIRTVQFVIDGLDAEGYAIDRRDFYLPYLKLVRDATPPSTTRGDRHRPADVHIAEDDAPLALASLRRVSELPAFPFAAAARSAFRKLAFDLDPHAFDKRTAVLFVEPPGAAELGARVRLVSDALLARKRVVFRYHGIHRGTTTDRTVEPYGLMMHGGHWYLIGRCLERADIRVFRVGRMADIRPNTRSPNTTDYDVPSTFRLADYAGRSAWELGEPDEAPVVARVLFHFPLSLWAERNGYGTIDEALPDGSAVRTFELRQVPPFLRWILSHEGDAEILAPAELQAELRAIAQRITDAHSEEDDDVR